MVNLLYKDEVYAVVGAAMDVYNILGFGFLEPVYQEALSIELEKRNIPFKSQVNLQISYKERLLEKTYIADFLVFNKVIVDTSFSLMA